MVNSDAQSRRLLKLAPADNVAVATADIAAGQEVALDNGAAGIVRVLDRLPVGHKVAVIPIRAGEKVMKFGCPIGSATRDIAPGQHVHTHNLKSDYIPTFTLEKGKTFVKA